MVVFFGGEMPQSGCGPRPPRGTRALDPPLASLKSDISWFLEQRPRPTGPETKPRQRSSFAETVNQRRGRKSRRERALHTAALQNGDMEDRL